MADLVGVSYARSAVRDDRPVRRRWHKLAPDRRVARRGPGARPSIVGRRSLALTRVRRARTARSTTTARTRAARSARARSRTGWLRCPWHGYDYDPLDRHAAAGLHRRAGALPGRGARRRHLRRAARRRRARAHGLRRRWSRRWWPGASTHVFGMVGHSNLGFADAMRQAEERGELTLHRHPPRGRRGVRGVGVRQAHRASGGVLRDRRAGLDQPAHRPLRRQGRRRAGARDLRAGAVEGARPRRVPGPRPVSAAFARRRAVHRDGARRLRPRRAGRHRASSTRSTAAASRTSCCPTRCRTSRRDAPRPRGPAGRLADLARRAAAGDAATPRCDLLARRPPAGDRRRPRRARRRWPTCVALAERLGAPGAHHVQGQGPGARQPPARRRRARPQSARRSRRG